MPVLLYLRAADPGWRRRYRGPDHREWGEERLRPACAVHADRSSPLHRYRSRNPLAASPKLQQIVRRTDEFPLFSAGFESATHKVSDTPAVFDLTEHRFDHPASFLIEFSAPFGQELSLHPLPERQVLRYPAPGRG